MNGVELVSIIGGLGLFVTLGIAARDAYARRAERRQDARRNQEIGAMIAELGEAVQSRGGATVYAFEKRGGNQ